MSEEPTWEVCRKLVGCPIISRLILGRCLLGWGSCSMTQEPKRLIQNSPAMAGAEGSLGPADLIAGAP